MKQSIIKKTAIRIFSAFCLTSFFCINYFILFTMHAKAYIDPSATTYLIQAIAAVVIAIGAALTIFRHKIVALFKKNKGNEERREVVIREDLDETSSSESDDSESK